MRKMIVYVVAASVGFCAVAPVPGYAQVVATPSGVSSKVDPVVVATFSAFPNGGQALTDRIRTLILQNNDLASDVARYLRDRSTLSTEQREAAEKGLAQALNKLGVYAQTEPSNDYLWAAIVGALAIAGGIAAYFVIRKKDKDNSLVFVSPN
jgi:hypothetical protein